MGYYTDYTVTCEPPLDDLDKLLEDASGYGSWYDGRAEEIKWYDNENHMRQLSKHYPNVTFRVQGYGENPGDMWVAFYRNGKRQFHSVPFIGPEHPAGEAFT